MPALSFQFSEAIDRRTLDKTLAKLRKLPGVKSIDRIDPESDDSVISRMCIASVVDRQNLETLRADLAGTKGVESVEEPPQRELVW